MSVEACLCSNREENIYNYGGFAANSAQQQSLGIAKNVTYAELTNNRQLLEESARDNIYLLQKYTARLKQGIKKLISVSAAEPQTITLEFNLGNQSYLAMALLNKQYELFVSLKIKVFRDLVGEEPFEINSLLSHEKHRIRTKHWVDSS